MGTSIGGVGGGGGSNPAGTGSQNTGNPWTSQPVGSPFWGPLNGPNNGQSQPIQPNGGRVINPSVQGQGQPAGGQPVNAGNGEGRMIPTGDGVPLNQYIQGGGSRPTFGSGSGTGGSSIPPASVDNGTVSYMPGGTIGNRKPHYVRIDPRTGAPSTYSVGPSPEQQEALRQQQIGVAQGQGMQAEALQLQNNLREWNNLAKEIRKLGIDNKLVERATQNLMNMLDSNVNNDSWLKNNAFQSQVNFVTDQMTRRLSAQGYSPGEHSYGDNTIAQATGAMAQDWTKFWYDANAGIVGQANQLGMVGAQGQLDAAKAQTNLNPGGIFVSGGVTQAASAINPQQAWQRWMESNKGWENKFGMNP